MYFEIGKLHTLSQNLGGNKSFTAPTFGNKTNI